MSKQSPHKVLVLIGVVGALAIILWWLRITPDMRRERRLRDAVSLFLVEAGVRETNALRVVKLDSKFGYVAIFQVLCDPERIDMIGDKAILDDPFVVSMLKTLGKPLTERERIIRFSSKTERAEGIVVLSQGDSVGDAAIIPWLPEK